MSCTHHLPCQTFHSGDSPSISELVLHSKQQTAILTHEPFHPSNRVCRTTEETSRSCLPFSLRFENFGITGGPCVISRVAPCTRRDTLQRRLFTTVRCIHPLPLIPPSTFHITYRNGQVADALIGIGKDAGVLVVRVACTIARRRIRGRLHQHGRRRRP